MNYMQISLVSYIQLCKKKRLFWGSCRNIISWGVHAEIILSRVIATRDSCAGPFFVVQKYRFLDLWTDFQSCNIKFIMLYSLGKSRTTRKKE